MAPLAAVEEGEVAEAVRATDSAVAERVVDAARVVEASPVAGVELAMVVAATEDQAMAAAGSEAVREMAAAAVAEVAAVEAQAAAMVEGVVGAQAAAVEASHTTSARCLQGIDLHQMPRTPYANRQGAHPGTPGLF